MKKLVASGKTVEEAVENGLSQLGVGRDRVRVTVLEQPAKGLFGLIGAKEAKVELELIPDAAEEAERFLREVAEAMRISVGITRQEADGVICFNVTGADLGIVIGRRGQTLDALQYLVNLVASRRCGRHLPIILDAEQFRERRRQTLESLSDRMANRVARTRREIVLEPMSSQERKIIHLRLQNHPLVRTYSQGEEPNRCVVIAPKT
ncbi:MAG: DNA-binding protein [Paenibacillaceae bacterium ZCTH02-B3]|nr:MAG: DNA-binding protein [Paenibacillaceae bacterium ZCTH02-B3]